MGIDVYPAFTREASRDTFSLIPGSSYIYADKGAEDRARMGELWHAKQDALGVRAVRVIDENRDSMWLQTAENSSDGLEFSLFDQSAIQEFLESLPKPLCIDITALGFGTWAALLRAALAANLPLKILYVEPKEYVRSSSPIGHLRYNLSSRTQGIAPLPGFARLVSAPDPDRVILMPLLGFEGDRLARVLEEVQAPLGSTYPVVGLPGFKPEYPFNSLEANLKYLDERRSTAQILYARANCPFGLYHLLSQTSELFPGSLIQVAAIGTRPHALGAAMFAIVNPSRVAILYDHPVRAPNRTTGLGRLCVYDVSKFMIHLGIVLK